MKIRTDFVTNSSSSCFILARTSKMNDMQKDAIVRFVENEFLGWRILGPDSTEEEINTVFEEEWEFQDKEIRDKVRMALKSGKEIYTDWVYFEGAEDNYIDVFEKIWRLMEENGDGNFEGIDTDLNY